MRTASALFLALCSLPALAEEPVTATTTEVDLALANEPHGVGLGIVIGEPTGLTVAFRPNDYNAVQGHVSWSLLSDRANVNVDYLQTFAILRPRGANLRLPAYVGVGGTVGVGGDGGPPWSGDPVPWLGARVPVGLALLPERTPIEGFVELAPTVFVVPETAIGLQGGLGVRAYF